MNLFLARGIYHQYAEMFLQPAQCDAVDEVHLLARLDALARTSPAADQDSQD